MRPWLDQNKANKAKLLRVENDTAHGSALALYDKAQPYFRLWSSRMVRLEHLVRQSAF